MTRRAPVLGLLALVAALWLAPSAFGQGGSSATVLFGGAGESLVTAVVIPVHAGGSLLLSFHGDPASGCAAEGVCGITGSVSWTPPSGGELFVTKLRQGRQTFIQANLDLLSQVGPVPGAGGTTHAQVTWADPSGADHESCADAVPTSPSLSLADHHGRLELSLAQTSPGVLQTRCGGPLGSDLPSLSRGLNLPLGEAMRGERVLHLARSGTFASHGFAGSVVSSLTLRLGRPQNLVSPKVIPGSRSTRYRLVELEDGARLSGTVSIAVRASSDLAQCGPLGSCGLTGVESISPTVSQLTDFVAEGPLTRPKRDFLAALGLSRTGRPARLAGLNFETWNTGGQLGSDVQQGQLACRDRAPLGGGSLQYQRVGRDLKLAYSASGLGGSSSLRSRCPGPFGPQGALATATVPLRDLARRSVTIRLTHGTSFSDDGYTATTTPDLVLTLTRKRVITRTFRVFTTSGSA